MRHRMKTGQIGNKKPLGLSPHARAEYGRILRRLTRGVTKTATKTAGKIVGKTAAKTVAKTAAKTAGKASIRGLGVIGAGITAFEVGRYVGKKIMEHPKAKKAGIKHIGKPLLKAETKIRSAIKRKLGGK